MIYVLCKYVLATKPKGWTQAPFEVIVGVNLNR